MEAPSSFKEELEDLINRHSKENGSNTPDFILANYLNSCLDLFDATIQDRKRWYGMVDDEPSAKEKSLDPPPYTPEKEQHDDNLWK